MAVTRRIAASDGDLLRRIRLNALADSPDAHTATLAQTESHDADHWARAAEANAAGASQATFFAEADGEVIGMVGAYMLTGGVVTVVGLWSAPGYRAEGVADDLLDNVVTWATRGGASQLRLWVVERDDEARRFYDRRGFTASGETMPYEPDPTISEVEMIVSLPISG